MKKYYKLAAFDQAANVLIITFPLFYLSVRHATNTVLFIFVCLSLIYWIKNHQNKYPTINRKHQWLTFFTFSALILATAITQFIRQDIYIQSFDGPLRIFLAYPLFLFLLARPISSIKLLEITLPLGLIFLFITTQDSESRHQLWGNRLSTYFVDPNTLGSQTSILGIICFLFIRQTRKNNLITILQAVGGSAGVYIAIYAESRGGWLAAPLILAIWLALTFHTDSNQRKSAWIHKILKLFIALLALGVIFIVSYRYIPEISNRVLDAYKDIIKWHAGVDYNSSVGTRLAMWEIALFKLAPIGGFSGIGNMSSIATTLTHLQLDSIKYKEAIFNLSFAGSHSDFLDNLLRMGYIGAIAYLTTILAPLVIFWRNRQNKEKDKRIAAHTGIYFIAGIFICGLANGMITHKYTCSFYGMIIACLLADILRPTQKTHSQPN